ncbi:MAG: IS200/IS605 family transposase [Planctomycetota bacterium]
MPQSYIQVLLHLVFSTKKRYPSLRSEMRPDLFAYMGGILKGVSAKPLIINGTDDHVHLLLAMPATRALADVARDLKANSSRWMHEHGATEFAWQNGYGAFSVSASNQDVVMKYIVAQGEHHRKTTFQEEFLALLRKHGVSYDERYIWA